MTRTDLDDEFDKDEFVDEFGGDEPSEPWHNSTRAVVGASVAGVAVIGVLVAAVMFMSGGDEPTDAPLNFVDPSFSETASESASSATTTTATITSTPKVSTTEINGPPGTADDLGFVGHQQQRKREQQRAGSRGRASAKTTTIPAAPLPDDRASTSPAHWVPDRSAERLLSVPVARYGPPDDPENYSDSEPTAYAAVSPPPTRPASPPRTPPITATTASSRPSRPNRRRCPGIESLRRLSASVR